MKSQPGTYALILDCPSDRVIQVGRLGTLTFEKGNYIYVGSAFGPGGVAARVKRHCRMDKALHWHIDYLRAAVRVTDVWYTHDSPPREHQWANSLAALAVASASGFGSSACDCESHLFRFRSRPALSRFRRELDRSPVSSCRVERWQAGEVGVGPDL